MLSAGDIIIPKNKVLLIGAAGYVGQSLSEALVASGWDVTTVDRNREAIHPVDYRVEYQSLKSTFLAMFDIIIWVAGHSSVAQCLAEPLDSMRNNCFDLCGFVSKIKRSTRFIYASSASIYDMAAPSETPYVESAPLSVKARNSYDASKLAFDTLVPLCIENFVALRFGTVCGYSGSLRSELIFNKMSIDAATRHKVQVSNPTALRSIVFLDQINEFVNSACLPDEVSPGIYNISNWGGAISELAAIIADCWGAEVSVLGESDCYSFRLDSSKAESVCPNFSGRMTSEQLSLRSKALVARVTAGDVNDE